MARASPRRPRDTGLRGEEVAAGFLAERGFVIVSRNLRTRYGEVDLLVRRRRLLVAVEVKTRGFDPAPEQSVSAAQLARLEKTLVALAPHLRPRPRQLRVDVVAVRWTRGSPPEVRHFPGQEWPANVAGQ